MLQTGATANIGGLAIVAGSGTLPRMLAEECRRRGRPYQVVVFEGINLDWAEGHPVIPAIFEKPGRLFAALRRAGVSEVTFAGGVRRPRLSPIRFDMKAIALAPQLFRALRSGDDAALRIVTAIFEDEGLHIVAAHRILSSLIAQEGVLTEARPSEGDRADAARAAEIVAALGAVDVGQGVVVAQGICLGIESIQGTDAMLDFVARTAGGFRPDPEGARGLLLKAPKPGQDWRTDLPAIGPDTVTRAHEAGLAGIVVQAGGVLILGEDETLSRANALGMFIWGRPA
ncbi:UDP-2,3-diacylglucosamine diphosphatase LpxI [Halovulum dunhuangense]|uniref:UDP-2,3-diacylglucosamine diphosphatase LpxI n=1 Tax=Halovulum dunhuangense TaxID=1505036 RepID=A0A849L343_9RHOB|nr:UDP-2,3-diacylglucosamine diphosphatase LpxI [Halovulum dunhuangense]NNU80705.1 UDP-2,3-diacylglucosamine diphosphatase LpxI [Halovulum dunhuangense]